MLKHRSLPAASAQHDYFASRWPQSSTRQPLRKQIISCRLPVPNMIADLDQAPKERVEKPVWRVAFFGRLEERKGIKLFVDAVQVSISTYA